eukprot:TRINITY_DN4937_c0_g1_i1.p1 TRINITY_DN4937_c0_g1~~TRINITY_DN4937_c0_g1_i1.p1  ORF type:complete len:208 (+),score=60.68 TRINITY_DN4937_c0_g1_i1:578-1201(+)
MSKKRGLSIDEKRMRMLELFRETKSVFTLKELEKVAAKEKGIVSQTVKDILQSLVDDNMVKQDKVGTGNYFWLFPSDEMNLRNVKQGQLEQELATFKRRRTELDSEHKQAMLGREDSEERQAKLARLASLEADNAQLKAQLQALAESNPETIKAMQHDAKVALEAANRWTDNIFSLKSWIMNQSAISSENFDAHFGLPANFDYVESK